MSQRSHTVTHAGSHGAPFHSIPSHAHELPVVPPSSVADDARAPSQQPVVAGGGRTGQERVEAVMGVLQGSGLDIRRGAIADVLAKYPDANEVEAAHQVMALWRSGRTRTSVAARLLDHTLGGQRVRLKRGPVGPSEPPAPLPEHRREAWTPIAAALQARLPEFKFHLWIQPLELVDEQRDHLVVRAPAQIRTSVTERYLSIILAAARAVRGSRATVEIVGESWRPGR